MSEIDITNYESAGQANTIVSYSGTAFLSVNGAYMQYDTDESYLNYSPDDVVFLEAHDEEFTYGKEPELHPLIYWQPVSGAEYYAVYQTAPGGVERLIYNASHQDDVPLLSVRVPKACVDGWHFFKVQAVDSLGNEATVTAFPERVFDLPNAVSDMSIAGTGGTFTITIEE